MNLPNSAGDDGWMRNPKSSYIAPTSGRASPALISLLSNSTISADMFFGPAKPIQLSNAYSGRCSAIVGTWGKAGERVGEVTAKARTCPPLMKEPNPSRLRTVHAFDH